VFCIPLIPEIKPPSTQSEEAPKASGDNEFKLPSSIKPVAKPPSTPPPLPLQYEKPEWSARPPDCNSDDVLDADGYCDHYFLEVLKNGTIVEKIKLGRELSSFGRLDTCDVLCEHPSLSRYHAVLQYSSGDVDNAKFPEGFYMYDLNSTHGTFVNKNRIRPNDYVKLSNDFQFKLGLSTRLYILHGPRPKNFSEDLNINLTHDQMKKIRDKYSKIALKLKIRKELEEEDRAKEDEKNGGEAATWGFKDELEDELAEEAVAAAAADEGTSKNQANPFSVIEEQDESFYSEDPKKALKNFFDREGDELEYDVDELASGKFKCRIRLPIVNNFGEDIYAECEHQGKKKDCK
jgi:pSer/pThr/pTyr-binding forkhead associated (FHA) protein